MERVSAGHDKKVGRKEGGDKEHMKEVKKKDSEGFDGLLRRFQQICLKDKLFTEIRKREYFIPPSILRKKKRARKAKKSRK